ncbi:response regulator [Aestuariivirga sp.]|uniref:response regulator n=1 Tax=Aestuariivirga sp. TaxID=2650926 RepID=UPI00391AE893
MSKFTQSPVNVLLVDDQPAKLLSYEVILAELGENLIRANSGREALEVLLRNEVAVVLIDVCMPELDGFDLAKMLREHPRHEQTAIIFVSAIQMSDSDRVKGYASGAVDYVSVPVVPEILRAKVRIFVDLFRKTRELERLNSELESRVHERTAALAQSTERLKESEERLRLASEAAGFGTYDFHGDRGEVYWSENLCRLVGHEAEGPMPLDQALGYIHPEYRDIVHRHILDPSPDTGRRELEFKIQRPDGDVRWLLDRGQTIVDPEDHRRWRVVGTILDITPRKLAEDYQRVLNQELDHRVKNILANVRSMVRLSSRGAQSLDQFVETIDSRLEAMAQAHELLRQSSWGAVLLSDLVTRTLGPFGGMRGDNLKVEGAAVHILPQFTQSLSLILHELATNASKYGAWTVPGGTVELSWQRLPTGSGDIRLSWIERGGPRLTAPTRKGFGLRFLELIVSGLGAGGRCQFLPGGLEYTLEGPMANDQFFDMQEPAAEMPAARPSAAHTPARAKRLRVLIVEDEPIVAMQLQADLEDAGHAVVGPAQTLAQGLALADGDIDLALIDFSLGKDTSSPIADRLLSRGIPFAFTTGYSDVTILPEHLRNALRLKKPYREDEVLRVVSILGEKATETARVGTAG